MTIRSRAPYTLYLLLVFHMARAQEKIYVMGYVPGFSDSSAYLDCLEMQAITGESARHDVYMATEFGYEEGLLTSVYNFEDGHRQRETLDVSMRGLPYHPVVPRDLYAFVPKANGIHYVGGEVPTDVSLPTDGLSLQYLGMVSREDEAFGWLPSDLHLFAPIVGNFDAFYVDYTNPISPQVLRIDTFETRDLYDAPISSRTTLVFERVRFAVVEGAQGELGGAGVASFVQNERFPRCPKSGRRMRFVCQLTSDIGGRTPLVPVARSTIVDADDGYARYFNRFSFWGSGDIFIFMDPESKIACYFIQST